MDLSKVVSKKAVFDNIMTVFGKSNYTIESDIFQNLGYILKDGQIVIYAHKNGILSIKIENILDFCNELLGIAGEYNENLYKRLAMDTKAFNSSGGKSKYE